MNAGHYLACCCHQPLEMETEFEVRLHMCELYAVTAFLEVPQYPTIQTLDQVYT